MYSENYDTNSNNRTRICPSCKNEITSEFAYACRSCGCEFERCVFSGLSITYSKNPSENKIQNYQILCSESNRKGYLIGLIMRPFSKNVFTDDYLTDGEIKSDQKFVLKLIVK